jgi:hypothetical protein
LGFGLGLSCVIDCPLKQSFVFFFPWGFPSDVSSTFGSRLWFTFFFLEDFSVALSFVMLSCLLAALALVSSVFSHGDHEHQTPVSGPHKSLWYNTIPGDGGTQVGDTFPPSVVLC